VNGDLVRRPASPANDLGGACGDLSFAGDDAFGGRLHVLAGGNVNILSGTKCLRTKVLDIMAVATACPGQVPPGGDLCGYRRAGFMGLTLRCCFIFGGRSA